MGYFPFVAIIVFLYNKRDLKSEENWVGRRYRFFKEINYGCIGFELRDFELCIFVFNLTLKIKKYSYSDMNWINLLLYLHCKM